MKPSFARKLPHSAYGFGGRVGGHPSLVLAAHAVRGMPSDLSAGARRRLKLVGATHPNEALLRSEASSLRLRLRRTCRRASFARSRCACLAWHAIRPVSRSPAKAEARRSEAS